MALFTKVYGPADAPTILFLHGGGVAGWMWARQIEHFQDRYRLLVPDLPGHGQSHDLPFVSMKDAATQVLEVIRAQANNPPLTIVGFSLGAQLAVELLSREPRLAEAAVVVSALVRPQDTARALVKPLLAMSMPLAKNRSFAKLQAKQLYIGDELFEPYFRDSQLIGGDELDRIMQANMSYALPEEFGRSEARVLTMVGAKERGMMLQSAREIMAATRNGAGVVVPGVGHGVSLAEPELFNQALGAWLEQRPLPTGLTEIRR